MTSRAPVLFIARASRWLCLAGAGCMALGACAVRAPGAASPNLERAKSEAGLGADLFEFQCASCHGSRGEGRGGAPQILGTGALRRYPAPDSTRQSGYVGGDGQPGALRPPGPVEGRPEFVTAENLQAYLSHHMPKVERQPLSDQDYWAIVQFMLIAHGSAVPAEGISRENGSRVAIEAP